MTLPTSMTTRPTKLSRYGAVMRGVDICSAMFAFGFHLRRMAIEREVTRAYEKPERVALHVWPRRR